MKYDKELKQAFRLADAADEIGMKYFLSRELKITTKPDDTPVTEGDTEIEKALSKIVIEQFGDSYVGEEGTRSGNSKKVWLIDPIDGTKNFLRGFPVWGSLISLKDGDEVIVASVSAPALGRRWWAVKNGGAFTRDVSGKERQIKASGISDLSNSFVLHNSVMTWDKKEGGLEKLLGLLRKTWRQRQAGDFLGFMYVAEGVADACFDSYPALWDIEASEMIVKEAGGKVWTSAGPQTKIDERRDCVGANQYLMDEILSHLGYN